MPLPPRTLSVVIPMYNEQATICQLLDRVATASIVGVSKEILIVNDGSRDDSRLLVQQWIETRKLHPGDTIRVLDQANAGKGAAVRTGIQASTGDVLIIQDADLEYDPQDYEACIVPILAGRTAVLYGSRELSGRNRRHSGVSFYLGGKLVTAWMNLLFGSRMTDEPTCYKTFSGPLIRALPFSSKGFEWEPEVTAKLLRLGYHIAEVPIQYYPRGIEEGKKIKWRDGWKALYTAWKWRWAAIEHERRALAVAQVPPAPGTIPPGAATPGTP